MRHHNKNRKFGRERDQRRALLRSLMEALIIRGRIRTTEAKAKEVRPRIEKMITLARRGPDVGSGRRLITARMGGRSRACSVLFSKIAPKYKERAGGYTRVVKLPPRKSDGARMAIIEFV